MAEIAPLYHRFTKELTVYPPEGRFYSNSQLKEYEANNGKRDVFQDGKGFCTINGVRVNSNTGQPIGKVAGVSLFSLSTTKGETEKAYRYAHEHIIGQTIVEQFRQEQRDIDNINDPVKQQEAQIKLDSDIDTKIPKCFTSSNPKIEGETELLTDRAIKDLNGVEVCQHTYLYPVRDDISVAEFGRYALCEKPENEWMVCTYQFKANAEFIDLPDVPDGDVDAACLLLQHIISSSSIAIEERFLAAWLQYFISYHGKVFQGHPNQIVSIGSGIVAELFVKAAELRVQQNSTPYPTPELECLITCARNFIKRSLLLILHFQIVCAVDAALRGASVTKNNESHATESLSTCAKEYLTSCGHEISQIEVSQIEVSQIEVCCTQNSLLLSCFCSPPVTEEEIKYMITNPLQTDMYKFELDGANHHAEKPVDFIHLGDEKGVDIAKPGDEKGVDIAKPGDEKGVDIAKPGDEKWVDIAKPGDEKGVDDICLRVELCKLGKKCPEFSTSRCIPDCLYKVSIQCNSITKNGKQCRNKTLNAIGLCYLHTDQKERGCY